MGVELNYRGKIVAEADYIQSSYVSNRIIKVGFLYNEPNNIKTELYINSDNMKNDVWRENYGNIDTQGSFD